MINSLPPELALLENFKQLLITGNPMRSIRRDIVNVSIEYMNDCIIYLNSQYLLREELML